MTGVRMSNQEETHGHPRAGYEKGNLISWNWLSSTMLASATTRLAVLNTRQEKISHVQKTLEFKKLQYKIPISWMDLQIWIFERSCFFMKIITPIIQTYMI
jgi:hypothetical protein